MDSTQSLLFLNAISSHYRLILAIAVSVVHHTYDHTLSRLQQVIEFGHEIMNTVEGRKFNNQYCLE